MLWILGFALSLFSSEPSVFSGMLASNCSGVIVYAEQVADAPAIAVTSAHCSKPLGSWKIDESHINVPLATARPFIAYNNKGQTVVLRAHRLLFASASKMDIAIYQLNKTYRELNHLGIQVKPIASTSTRKGAAVQIVSGLYNEAQGCKIASPRVMLRSRLGTKSFTWKKAMRLGINCKSIRPGFSGSPVLNPQGQVVGLINSRNSSGNCHDDVCEESTGSATAYQGHGYAQPLPPLKDCFDRKGELDLRSANCPLHPKG